MSDGSYPGSRFMAPQYVALAAASAFILPAAAIFIYVMIYPR